MLPVLCLACQPESRVGAQHPLKPEGCLVGERCLSVDELVDVFLGLAHTPCQLGLSPAACLGEVEDGVTSGERPSQARKEHSAQS